MTDELFIRKMRDVASRSEYDTSVTPFLTPAEQCEAFDSLPEYRSKLFFWGAFRGAERRSAFFLPDWLADAHETGESLFSPERESLFLSLCESGGIVPAEHVTSLSVTAPALSSSGIATGSVPRSISESSVPRSAISPSHPIKAASSPARRGSLRCFRMSLSGLRATRLRPSFSPIRISLR